MLVKWVVLGVEKFHFESWTESSDTGYLTALSLNFSLSKMGIRMVPYIETVVHIE